MCSTFFKFHSSLTRPCRRWFILDDVIVSYVRVAGLFAHLYIYERIPWHDAKQTKWFKRINKTAIRDAESKIGSSFSLKSVGALSSAHEISWGVCVTLRLNCPIFEHASKETGNSWSRWSVILYKTRQSNMRQVQVQLYKQTAALRFILEWKIFFVKWLVSMLRR